MMQKDDTAKTKKSATIESNHQTPPKAIFSLKGEKLDDADAAWMCKSAHVKGVAAGMKVYNPGDRKACVACQTSRSVVKKEKRNGKSENACDDAGEPIIAKTNRKAMDFKLPSNTFVFQLDADFIVDGFDTV
jgi:hypothetical protein